MSKARDNANPPETEIDLSKAERGVFKDWYDRAAGRFSEVPDDVDATRKVTERRPIPTAPARK